MIILGMNFSHDGAVAVVKDGKLVNALATERVTRQKKARGVTTEQIHMLLADAHVQDGHVDAIALSDYMRSHDHMGLDLRDPQGTPIEKTAYTIYGNHVPVLQGTWKGKPIPVYMLPHQLAHAAATYYTSPFDSAVCMTVDSSFGEMADNSLISVGTHNKLIAHECANLISGIGYAVFTELLGFSPAYAKAGTTMGLSCYGACDVSEYVQQLTAQQVFLPQHNAELEYRIFWSNVWEKLCAKHAHEIPFREKANLAATIQHVLAHSLHEQAQKIRQDHLIPNLCLGGGSLLNCMTNTQILNSKLYDHVHHFPACGDDGTAVGSALYAAHHVWDLPRHTYTTKDLCYLGPTPAYQMIPPHEKVAHILAQGGIVAWCMGRSEFGPRALGNRSILADPRSYHMREKINFAVKQREWFRPLAPVVMEEHAAEWFDVHTPSPFMLYTHQVLKPDLIPAVTHVDGSARPQTVNSQSNPDLYKLLQHFMAITQVPVLMNTSLNGANEPILETAAQVRAFFAHNTMIDAAVINGELLVR